MEKSKNSSNNTDKILVDSAEHLLNVDSSSSLNNREKVELIANSISGKTFEEWIQRLNGRGVTPTQARDIETHYSAYTEQVSRASLSLIRWICHGHIGFDFLRALYERCVIDSCPSTHDKAKELSGISWVAKDKMLHSFINSWVKKSLQNQCEYPIAIFELLSVAP